jgi:hypothetical protein
MTIPHNKWEMNNMSANTNEDWFSKFVFVGFANKNEKVLKKKIMEELFNTFPKTKTQDATPKNV